jgi:predicted lipid-binding transport protein (Tim44 family)
VEEAAAMTQAEADGVVLFVVFWVIWSLWRNALNEQSRSSRPDRPVAGVGLVHNQQVADLLPDRHHRNAGGTDRSDAGVALDLELIRQADPAFDVEQFLESGCLVYETVIMAFANGDRELLRDLVSADVYSAFSEIILKREARRESVEINFVCLDDAELVNVALFNKYAQITIGFAAQLVTATRAENGAVVDGDPETIVNVSDLWTFARELTPRTQAWKLVETSSR